MEIIKLDAKWIWIINIVSVTFATGYIAFTMGHAVGMSEGFIQGYGDSIENDFWDVYNETIIDNESVYNYDVLRDICLPSLDEYVNISSHGFESGSWCYLVNHSSINYSSYFKDGFTYRILIPIEGRVTVFD